MSSILFWLKFVNLGIRRQRPAKLQKWYSDTICVFSVITISKERTTSKNRDMVSVYMWVWWWDRTHFWNRPDCFSRNTHLETGFRSLTYFILDVIINVVLTTCSSMSVDKGINSTPIITLRNFSSPRESHSVSLTNFTPKYALTYWGLNKLTDILHFQMIFVESLSFWFKAPWWVFQRV